MSAVTLAAGTSTSTAASPCVAGGLNTYAYAEADPGSLSDPLGLKPGELFDSSAEAEADRALYVPLVHEHNWAFDFVLVAWMQPWHAVLGRRVPGWVQIHVSTH